MKRSILISLIFLCHLSFGQVKPHEFPEETNPTNLNFEVYSQKGGINRRASLNNLRKPLALDLKATGYAYEPDAYIGSIPDADKNTVGASPSGKVWLLDRDGDVQLLYDPSATGGLDDGDYGDVLVSVGGTVMTVDALAISTGKLANGAVTNAKLATDAVANANMADNAVGTNELAANAVTNAKIADNAVNSAKIQDATIVNADIANATINLSKLSASGAADGAAPVYTGTAWSSDPMLVSRRSLAYSCNPGPTGTCTINISTDGFVEYIANTTGSTGAFLNLNFTPSGATTSASGLANVRYIYNNTPYNIIVSRTGPTWLFADILGGTNTSFSLPGNKAVKLIYDATTTPAQFKIFLLN